VQEIISKRFQDAESLSKPVKIGFELELDSRPVESTFPEFKPDTCDLTTIKENFRQLVNILALPIEYGSGYYWEIRKFILLQEKRSLQVVLRYILDVHNGRIGSGKGLKIYQ